ncbi:MAG TPA: MdtA/MuxA family multidrug efflux RND transporter periplasmic adaptor subunit [Novimethylophilus sp.]|jgi:multidrug efflux system membrane fusion protein|uniref:MdtA/MuxA family multidrug efflux RND transporter periplasmic adaptor subunit n=1 Tax=Novimethylophilus sp. TaxID=2137426 RepID=UPI002F40DBD0
MTLDQHQQPLASMDKKPVKIRKWLLALMLIAAMAAAILVYRHQGERVMTRAKSAPDSRPMTVLVALAVKQDVKVYLDALGTVTSRNAVTVKARVDGQLMSVRFREGQAVKAGELLAEIDPRPFEVQLAQVNGQLAKDKASLDNAQIDLERYKTLLSQDSISKQQVDTQEALVRQYRGALAADQGQVDNARLQLSYSRITAPISGRVGLRQVDPGNMIHASDAGGIVTITQLQPITVLFNIPEDDLPAVIQRTRAGVVVTVEAYDRQKKNKLATGVLLTTDNQIDPATGTIKLRAEFRNDDTTLFPNQFVNVRVLVDVQKDAVVIPAAAVQRGRNGEYVYVLKDAESVVLRPVRPSAAEGENISIASGLSAGESVVVDGADKLRDGAKVKPVVSGAVDKADRKSQSEEGKRRHRSEA